MTEDLDLLPHPGIEYLHKYRLEFAVPLPSSVFPSYQISRFADVGWRAGWIPLRLEPWHGAFGRVGLGKGRMSTG